MLPVLVTGINGFIGSHVASRFQRNGSRIIGLDVGERPNNSAVEYCQLRLPSDALAQHIRQWRPGICLHCAGPASVAESMQDPAADFEGSVVTTANLLDSLRREAPECRFIYPSSAAVYGNPISLPIDESAPVQPVSPYGFHKAMCEELCREYHHIFKLPTTSVRIFSAYGPGLRKQVIFDTSRKLTSSADDSPIELHGTGEETRDFIHVSDIAAAIWLVAQKAVFEGETYNLASGQSVSIRKVAEILQQRLAPDRKIRFNGVQRRGDPLYWSATITKVQALGFQPEMLLETGLAEYAKWLKQST